MIRDSQTTWGSKNAEDLYKIAVIFANFNPKELMLEIARLSPKGNTVYENIVCQAMENCRNKHMKENPELYSDGKRDIK